MCPFVFWSETLLLHLSKGSSGFEHHVIIRELPHENTALYPSLPRVSHQNTLIDPSLTHSLSFVSWGYLDSPLQFLNLSVKICVLKTQFPVQYWMLGPTRKCMGQGSFILRAPSSSFTLPSYVIYSNSWMAIPDVGTLTLEFSAYSIEAVELKGHNNVSVNQQCLLPYFIPIPTH